jgi:hypothetical protein
MKRALPLLLAALAGCGAEPPIAPPPPPILVDLPPPASTATLQVAEDRPVFRCPGGELIAAGNRSYCIQKQATSFRDSERWCAANGGHLAMIGSEEESRALKAALGSPVGMDQSVWIGLVEPQEGRWMWSTGAPLGDANWAPGEPNNYGGNENCGELYPSSGEWNDIPCDATRPYLCEKRAGQGGALRCTGTSFRAGAIEYCYERGRAVTWDEAERACKAQGGTLASLGTRREIDAFRAAAASRLGSHHAWIGFTDEGHEGRWTTVTGRPIGWSRWRPGEPNNAGGNENCAEWYLEDMGWNDIPCDLAHVGICAPR